MSNQQPVNLPGFKLTPLCQNCTKTMTLVSDPRPHWLCTFCKSTQPAVQPK